MREEHSPADSPIFGSEHEMLRATVRRFVEQRVLPNADAWEEAGFVPREILREMAELGLLGIGFGREWGGSELDTLATVVLAEELGRSTYGGFAITVLVHTDMAAPHLKHAGSPAQLDRYMPDIVAGRKIAAVAMTEADAGSDLASMRTTARLEGGSWVLNGSKLFITNGVHGDVVFVAAKTGAPGRNRDISMFIVEKGTPGFRVARPMKKHGWRRKDLGRACRQGTRRLPALARVCTAVARPDHENRASGARTHIPRATMKPMATARTPVAFACVRRRPGHGSC